MDKFDLKNIDEILNLSDHHNDVGLNDDDLEKELELLLSGKTTGKRPIVSARNNVQPKSKPRRPDYTQTLDLTKIKNSYDLDMDDDDDESLEDDTNLLAELENIVGSSKQISPASSAVESLDSITKIKPQAPLPPLRKQSVPKSQPEFKSNLVDFDFALDSELKKQPTPYFPSKQFEQPIESSSKSFEKASNENVQSEKQLLTELRDQYKRTALIAKQSNDLTSAMEFMKVAKQLDLMVNAINEGKPVDLTNLPAQPNYKNDKKLVSTSNFGQKDNQNETVSIDFSSHQYNQEEAEKFFHAPPPPKTILEALEQRLAKYRQTLAEANESNNASKARRIGRIIKQYETAIKCQKTGKEFDYDSLPVPPGFAEIPKNDSPNVAPALPTKQQQPSAVVIKEQAPNRPTGKVNVQPNKAETLPKTHFPKAQPRATMKKTSSIGEKQLTYLTERQKLFKEAALEAKQKGDINQAKEYLRLAKGFDPLIEATRSGLPIDATSIPTPPQISEDFVVVTHKETISAQNEFEPEGERDEMYRKLELELEKQIEMCHRNKEHFLKLGDVSSSSKFEKYAVDSCKDLDMLKSFWRNNDKLPRFRYETRTFSIVVSNTNLTVNDLSVKINNAFDLPVKPDTSLYFKIEFPYPIETPQILKTKTVKNAIQCEINETVTFTIDRKSRQLVRVFKRKPIRIELYLKGGLFRSDTLIGFASIPLSDFETKCNIYDCFPLMDEKKKAIGGRIEVKVFIREPLLAKQVEEVKEKWLLLI